MRAADVSSVIFLIGKALIIIFKCNILILL